MKRQTPSDEASVVLVAVLKELLPLSDEDRTAVLQAAAAYYGIRGTL